MKISSFIFSLIALGVSIYALSSQYYTDITTTVLSLVGISVTLIVGISVVDAFAVHSAFHKMEEKMGELSNRMDKLTELEMEVRKMKKKTNMLFHHTWGLVLREDQPYDALNEFWRAFEYASKDNDIKRAMVCLENMENVIENIIQQKNMNSFDEKTIPITISEELKQTSTYIAFEDRINELINKTSKLTKK